MFLYVIDHYVCLLCCVIYTGNNIDFIYDNFLFKPFKYMRNKTCHAHNVYKALNIREGKQEKRKQKFVLINFILNIN